MESRRFQDEVLGKSWLSMAEETEGGCGCVWDGDQSGGVQVRLHIPKFRSFSVKTVHMLFCRSPFPKGKKEANVTRNLRMSQLLDSGCYSHLV